MKKYGKYGIGLTKEWANRNGLNPVMYVSKHCDFTDNFNNALYKIYPEISKIKKMNNEANKLNDNPTNHYMNILDAYRYMKNYEGTLKRDGYKEDDGLRRAGGRDGHDLRNGLRNAVRIGERLR